MTDPERRRRVEDLCDAALDRDVRERAAFVAAACGHDEALRREVEALLAHAQTAEGFLEAPIGEVAAHVLADEHGASLVGRQIGSHKILSLLGAGGMGEVYRARDTKLGRDVAIKVVARRLPFRPGAARALRTRGAGAGDAEPSAHRRDLWIGGGRRRPRPRARTRGRRDARRASGVGSVADSGGAHASRARSRRRSKPRTRRASSTAI